MQLYQFTRYYTYYRLPGGKQKFELVGTSINESRDADGERRSQKRENRIFDIEPDSKITFQELTERYQGPESVKGKVYYQIFKFNLSSFNKAFGLVVVKNLKPVDLENHQTMRKRKATPTPTSIRRSGLPGR